MSNFKPQSRWHDCRTCQWPVPRDDKGLLPFLCPMCGEPITCNPDLPAKRPVRPGVDFGEIKRRMEQRA